MIGNESLRRKAIVAKQDAAMSLAVGRALFDIVPEALRNGEIRGELAAVGARPFLRMARGSGRRASVMWGLGKIGGEVFRSGGKGAVQAIPRVRHAVASAALAKAGRPESAAVSEEVVFKHELHDLEAGIHAVAAFTDTSLEKVLHGDMEDHGETEEDRKEREAAIVNMHIDPLVGLGKVWVDFAKTEKVSSEDRTEPRSDMGYTTDYAFVLEQGGLRPEYSQLVVIGLYEHFLQNGGDMEPADGAAYDLAPYKKRPYPSGAD